MTLCEPPVAIQFSNRDKKHCATTAAHVQLSDHIKAALVTKVEVIPLWDVIDDLFQHLFWQDISAMVVFTAKIQHSLILMN